MLAPRRRAAVKAMRTIAGAGCVVVLGASVAVAFAPIYAAVVGTLACAVVACSASYAAFEGFDERIRRRPDA